MSQFVFKMPDLGEGTVEAEIVAWHTRPGDAVDEDQIIVEVMTDKAAVEVPAPVSGRVVSITGEPGDKVAVGAPLIVFELAVAEPAQAAAVPLPPAALPPAAGGTSTAAGATLPVAFPVVGAEPPLVTLPPAATAAAGTGEDKEQGAGGSSAPLATLPPVAVGRVKASPANRRRAREAGIDLATVAGTGPGGRILRGDLGLGRGTPLLRPPFPGAAVRQEQHVGRGNASAETARTSSPVPANSPAVGSSPAVGKSSAAVNSSAPATSPADVTEIKVIGLRRVIAERMSEAKRNIPHFAYIEEIDVTELEALRLHLNGKRAAGEPGLTYLPLVILALARAVESFPQCNARYDAARGVIVRHRAVHVGVATQTPDGLKVPVLRNVQALSLSAVAAEVRRLAERARSNTATREELNGSTITVTSLGKLGGIASTPVINSPEVAIVGLNKAVDRPVVHEGKVIVRRIMNLSSSFDHRFVDGYDAAAMIQALKELLEHPATIFIPKVTSP